MENPGSEHVTQILAEVADGRDGAADELLALVYDELRTLARQQMARVPSSDSLPPTALVHEVYIRLLGKATPSWKDRRHFFAIAARAMRSIIVDQARMRAAPRRGGDRKRVPLHDSAIEKDLDTDDMLSVDDVLNVDAALTKFQSEDKRCAEVVMLRFFAGLTVDETAAALELSTATVDRDWVYAKAWLRRELDESTG